MKPEHYTLRPGQMVYFAKPETMDGPIKIGCSAEPMRRLQQLMAWCPFPLELLVAIPGGYRLERDLHEYFAKSNRYNEWFDPTPELLGVINQLSAGMPIERIIDFGAQVPRTLIQKQRRSA